MNDDFDLQRLAEIPDPFAGAARTPDGRASDVRLPSSASRSRVRALRVAAAAAAVLCEAAWIAFVERRSDLPSIPASRLALDLALPLVAAALALSAAWRGGKAGLGETKARVVALAFGSPVLFAAATALLAPAGAPDSLFWRHAAGCMLLTAVLAAAPLALGLLAFRRAFAAGSTWRGAALGVACGAIAAATMSLVCPLSAASHVILGHGAMMVLAGAAGAAMGRRVCRA